MKEIVVIGGGPAGVFSAIYAKNKNTRVRLLERNSKIGRKLAITGKGRCNLTNSRDISDFFQEINRNANFCYSSLYSFTNYDLMNFFEARSVELKSERGSRVFPVSDSAFDIIDALKGAMDETGVILEANTLVKAIEKKKNFIIKTDKDTTRADAVIIATGGMSYPTTGSDGKGYALAESLGHQVCPIHPSLVPIDLKDPWLKDLAGVSLKNISLKLYYENKKLEEEFGELLFTHSGISGPISLKMSTIMDQGTDYSLSLDLKPALSHDELDRRIQKDFKKNINKSYKNSLGALTIKALIPIIIERSGIASNKVVNQITKKERQRLVDLFKDFKLDYKGLKDVKYGIITRGGIIVDEINPTSMESKLVEDLYFAGEIIDVDANTGGYNLQIAFSTGFLAGSSCGGKL